MLNESDIFIVNAYRNENVITSHSKRVRMHGLECPLWCVHIFMPSLFFINLDTCVEYFLRILYAHFISTQSL